MKFVDSSYSSSEATLSTFGFAELQNFSKWPSYHLQLAFYANSSSFVFLLRLKFVAAEEHGFTEPDCPDF